jgi:hypothetical protein
MTVLLSRDIIGVGEESFGGGARVNYVLAYIITEGPRVTKVEVPDSNLNAGWWALGAQLDVIDGLTRIHWRDRHYINFSATEWSPEPQTDYLANDFAVWAERIRWSLTPGTTAYLHVYGV